MRTPLALFLSAVLFAAPGFADANKDQFKNVIPESKNQIIKFTDKGITPESLTMKLDDSIVFFLNDTTDALATLEVDFAGKHTHCSSTNMKIVETNGKIRSVRPFGPKDFATTCFHDKGSYPVVVYGLPKHPEGMKSTIVVE